MTINDTLFNIKKILENSIIQGGTVGKRNLIRTSQPINFIHEIVKHGFINLNIDKKRIFPHLKETVGEVAITGFIKKKNQDIVVLPNNIKPTQEFIDHLNFTDPYGLEYSERILSVNVRSQLSSVAKNFDTIFERTFAESYNLHQRLNNIVLGEVFLLPVREFDDSYSDKNIVKYKELGSRVENQLSKYIRYFNLINNRNNTSEDFHKYERVCLLLVDFSLDQPKLYQTTEELINDGIVSKDFSLDLKPLNFDDFFNNLLDKYYSRFIS
jgi:hypothetical protein